MGESYQDTYLSEVYPLKPNYGITDGPESSHHNGSKTDGFKPDTTDFTPKKRKKRWRVNWRTVLYNFSQSTTLHGVNKITEDNPFTIRRIIWVCIVLLGIALFCWQLLHSVLYYLSRPVTVNVKINYNQSITFPAVTICNQNDFRTTATSRRGMYYLVQDFYSDIGKVNLTYYNANNMSLAEFYTNAGHQKEDMIVGCHWDEEECSHEDFITILSDYGVCYTFNSGKNSDDVFRKEDIRKVSRTGADRGLRMRLNIEQYEYMVGPNPGAGIKILIHDNTEVPLVKDLGNAIPPGTHAYVGIQIVQVKNLEQPWGECNDSVTLDFFKYYSIPACLLNCKEKFLLEQCGCRDVYMPAKDQVFAVPDFKHITTYMNSSAAGSSKAEPVYPPVCTLDEYQSCAVRAMGELYQNSSSKGVCNDCPIPCVRTMYDTTITYAYASRYDTDIFLQSNETEMLRARFLDAREKEQRMNMDLVVKDSELIYEFDRTVSYIDAVFKGISRQLEKVKDTISDIVDEMKIRTHFHSVWGVGKVKYTMEYDFLRGFDVINERTFSYVTSSYIEIAEYIERAVNMANASPPDAVSYRESLYLICDQQLYEKIVLSDRALDNITEVHNGFLNAERIVSYKASPKRRYDATWVFPGIIHTNKNQISYYNKFVLRTNQFKTAINNIRELLGAMLRAEQVNMTAYVEERAAFEKAARSFNYYRFMFEDRIAAKPLELADKIIETFEDRNQTFFSQYKQFLLDMGEVMTFVSQTADSWNYIVKMRDTAVEYLRNMQITKASVAEGLTSKQMEENVRQLELFMSEARARSHTILDSMLKLRIAYKALWSNMLSEPSTKQFYAKIHEDVINAMQNDSVMNELFSTFKLLTKDSLKPFNNRLDATSLFVSMNANFTSTDYKDKSKAITSEFKQLEKLVDMASDLGEIDAKFFKATEKLQIAFKSFEDGNTIDTEFFRNNFLNVDIFMKELSYEEIEQQVAYDMTALWSDIGGSMGLFIGASVITVFELLDVIILNIYKIHCSKR